MRHAKRIIAALLLILSLAIAFPGKVSQYGIHQAISPTLDDIDSHYMSWYQDRISLTLVSFDCARSNLKTSFQEHELGIGSYAVDTFGISHPNLKCNTYVVKVNKRLTLKRWFVSSLLAVIPIIVAFTEYRRWRRTRTIPCPCPHCSYNLTGNESGACPECGEKIEAAE